MTIEQTLEKLAAMKFRGMHTALAHWWDERSQGGADALEPDDLVGLLTDAEWTARENRKRNLRAFE